MGERKKKTHDKQGDKGLFMYHCIKANDIAMNL